MIFRPARTPTRKIPSHEAVPAPLPHTGRRGRRPDRRFRRALETALKDNYFGAEGSLTSYYNEVTRGTTTFEAAEGDGVTGPVDIDLAATGCDTGEINDLTREALAAKGVPEDSYDHLSLVFPSEKAGCDWLALGTVGGSTTWMPAGADGKMSMTALVHEFGHNFGYSHHMRLRCPDGDLGAGCEEDGTSHKTPMGGGGWEAGLTSPELLHNKWLTGGEVAKPGKSGTYDLRPLYGSGGGVRAIDIPLGGDRVVVKAGADAATVRVSLDGVTAPTKAAEPAEDEPTEASNEARPARGSTELAETGGDSDTTLAYSVGGGLMLAFGGAFLLKSRARRTPATSSSASGRRSR